MQLEQRRSKRGIVESRPSERDVRSAREPLEFSGRVLNDMGADMERALVESEAADCLTLVEVMLPKQDVPELLAAITRGVAAINGSKRAAAA